MIIEVQSRRGVANEKEPVSLFIEGQERMIIDILDRWPGQGHCYFKVTCDDLQTRMLRHDHAAMVWEIYERPKNERPNYDKYDAMQKRAASERILTPSN